MKKISYITPTRIRPQRLLESVNSLVNNASHPDYLEIVLRVDSDDKATLDIIPQLPKQCKIIVGDRMNGYHSLCEYYDDCLKIASGDWIALWNDDAYMRTKGFDDVIRSYEDNFVVIHQTNDPPENNGSSEDYETMPIIPRKWIELTGHLSKSLQVDTWIRNIALPLNLYVRPNIVVSHLRIDDELQQNRHVTHEDITSPQKMRMMEQEFHLICWYLLKHQGKII